MDPEGAGLAPEQIRLSLSESKVVNHLKADWQKPHRVTTIDQAMQFVGVPYDERVRRHIGLYLSKRRGETPRRMQACDPHTFILTNNERLLARYLLSRPPHPPLDKGGQGGVVISSPADCAKALDLPEEEVTRGIGLLAQMKFLERKRGAQQGVYVLGRDYESFLVGAGFHFYCVNLDDGKSLNLDSAPSALSYITVAPASSGQNAGRDACATTLESACAHCPQRITLAFANGNLVSDTTQVCLLSGADAEPPSLFLSAAHLNAYLAQHPEKGKVKAQPLAEVLASLTAPAQPTAGK